MSRPIISNVSFPPGTWNLKYIQELDRYRITTEYGDFIADVGPTLVAHWLVKVYNAIYLGADDGKGDDGARSQAEKAHL